VLVYIHVNRITRLLIAKQSDLGTDFVVDQKDY